MIAYVKYDEQSNTWKAWQYENGNLVEIELQMLPNYFSDLVTGSLVDPEKRPFFIVQVNGVNIAVPLGDEALLDHARNVDAHQGHTHGLGDLTGVAATSHSHTIANVTNLQSTLDGKSATSHSHTEYAATGHTTDTAAHTGGLGTATGGSVTSCKLWIGTVSQHNALPGQANGTLYFVEE